MIFLSTVVQIIALCGTTCFNLNHLSKISTIVLSIYNPNNNTRRCAEFGMRIQVDSDISWQLFLYLSKPTAVFIFYVCILDDNKS